MVSNLSMESRSNLPLKIQNTTFGNFSSESAQNMDQCFSMDERGRALDNVFVERLWRSLKHGYLYLKGYSSGTELHIRDCRNFRFYNT